ncbi:EAL domain-containing protein [Terriglobus albidus]|uniref:EAL domain-containing protein n=1 Tax=Terriglobus albidus TaxID=1592106 RepID=UPI0021E03A9D|nr:EAL domain-containing protein [Terriglobus albidus]
MYINLAKREQQRRTISGLLDGDIPFGFHYQPIVDLERGLITGYEALARFPAEIASSPDQVFRAAGDLGRRADLECVVLRSALWERSKLPPKCFLTINVGPSLLLSRQWQQLLRETGHFGGTVFEITEDEPIHDYTIFRSRLDQIREAGGHIAVDDTGAGYASLKHVMELRPNFIKLDRFFVGGCHKEPARSSLIEMMSTMAGRIDATIIAEGVETASELEELIHLGVSLAQGYYLGKPSAEMHPLPALQAEAIRSRAQARQQGNLWGVIESCFTCFDAGAAATYLDANAEAHVVLLVDEGNRPSGIIERHALIGIRHLPQPMKVQRESDLREVLQRCLSRPSAHRFDPVAVIRADGQMAGVATVDRMVKFVLENGPLLDMRAAEVRALMGSADRDMRAGTSGC